MRGSCFVRPQGLRMISVRLGAIWTYSRLLALLAVVVVGVASAATSLRINRRSAGPVRMGMRLGALKQIPGVSIKRTRDGEGLALVVVSKGREDWMTVYADEPDPDKPIDPKAGVKNIEIISSQFATAEGVRPGMKVAEVERRYGRITGIRRSEIEGREFATFARSPMWMTFRVTAPGGFAGVYGKGEITRRTAPGAHLASISLAAGV